MLFRCLLSLAFAAVLVPATARSAAAQSDSRSVDVEDGGEGGSTRTGWHPVTGLRLEQWIAPAPDHLRFDVRLTLPEMALGQHVSIETFKWERLDVAEGRSERGENGSVYHLLGARYRRESGGNAFFIGAHALSWSGHARPLVPWVGLRLGEKGGPSIAAEAHLLGLGPGAGEMLTPLDDADVSVAVNGPRIGPCRLGARGRARDIHHPDRHQREEMMSLGLDFAWGRRRVFVGVGIQHELRRARTDDEPAAMPPAAGRMQPAASPVNVELTAIMLHLDAETPLPRSLLAD